MLLAGASDMPDHRPGLDLNRVSRFVSGLVLHVSQPVFRPVGLRQNRIKPISRRVVSVLEDRTPPGARMGVPAGAARSTPLCPALHGRRCFPRRGLPPWMAPAQIGEQTMSPFFQTPGASSAVVMVVHRKGPDPIAQHVPNDAGQLDAQNRRIFEQPDRQDQTQRPKQAT